MKSFSFWTRCFFSLKLVSCCIYAGCSYSYFQDYKKKTRPNDKPPGLEIHKAKVMTQKGVKKQYAYSEDSVVLEPEVLDDNAGETCTRDLVDEAIAALESLGYGLGKRPHDYAKEHVSGLSKLIS